MAIPTYAESDIYKSRTIQSQVRVAVEVDYPVFSGDFNEQFAGAALDTSKWFQYLPSWGLLTVGGGTLNIGAVGAAICPAWIQSRHNLAFPLNIETDWTFTARIRFPVVTGFGVFVRICGSSFRDAEAIWALKCNSASGEYVTAPDGYAGEVVHWNSAPGPWRRYRVIYDASLQTYTIDIDQDDNGVYEWTRTIAVNRRYAEAIVIGNSTAIQGALGTWTQIEVDYIRVQGTAEAVDVPAWAAPYLYDGTKFAVLPTLLGGRTNIDLDNAVDAADIDLENILVGVDEDFETPLYTETRFLNRRAIIEARAGNGNGDWTPWQIMFAGLCAEKEINLQENGNCQVSLPMRDRWRGIADDMQVLGCYSDAGLVIPGVGMNMTVAQILADILQNKVGIPAAAMNIVATPWNTPRNYNVFRRSGLQAVKTLADHAALAVWQRMADARIEVQEYPWGTGMPGYVIRTSEEVIRVRWAESAFDVVSAEQLAFENTNISGFTHTWPPHRAPFYGQVDYDDSVATQDGADHNQRPVATLKWWRDNRKLGSLEAEMRAQFWAELGLEIGLADDRFLGRRADRPLIIDGIEHSWQGEDVVNTRLRLIDPEHWRWRLRNLPT